jgi:hypothetical protein
MDAQPRDWVHERLLGALAGLQLGVVGGLIMLAWYIVMAPVVGQPWWAIPNVLASRYFVYQVLGSGPGFPTLAGASFQLVTAGLVGTIVGLFTPSGRLPALGAAISWYLLSYFLVWRRVAPLAVAYAPQSILAIGYFLYGSALGYHRAAFRRLLNSQATQTREFSATDHS